MSMLNSLLERLTGKRTAQNRWNERWADPRFYSEYRLDELAHYSVLAGYVKTLKPGASVLDVGCGDGILRSHFSDDAFSTYLGIDFPEAIARAAKRMDDQTSFQAIDMRAFSSSAKFEVIVFNESLYYVNDPIVELRRYSHFLRRGGIFLVSMHRKPRSERIWKDIGATFEMLDRVTIANRRGVEWILGAFQPKV